MENSKEKYLNIVSFNVPYPPNYGGIIDVFYKIKALKETGVKIILHCYDYEERSCKAKELETLCEKVFYYRRKTGLTSNFSYLPYNVESRKDPELLNNLLANSYPILFEGLHTCCFATDRRLRNRTKVCRMTNIEHDYYHHLARAEKNLLKKAFFIIEALKFRCYQPVLRKMDYILAVSETDKAYLDSHFDSERVCFIPCFHKNDSITSRTGQSDFVLYHAKLSVPENLQAAQYLIENVFSKLDEKCIIAGMNPPDSLKKKAEKYSNISIIGNPDEKEMSRLIAEAQVNMLITFQPTGLKLKLLNSIFAGRHTIVNDLMIAGTGLGELCRVANSPMEMVEECKKLMNTPYTPEISERREKVLFPLFSNKEQASHISKLLFHED